MIIIMIILLGCSGVGTFHNHLQNLKKLPQAPQKLPEASPQPLPEHTISFIIYLYSPQLLQKLVYRPSGPSTLLFWGLGGFSGSPLAIYLYSTCGRNVYRWDPQAHLAGYLASGRVWGLGDFGVGAYLELASAWGAYPLLTSARWA